MKNLLNSNKKWKKKNKFDFLIKNLWKPIYERQKNNKKPNENENTLFIDNH